METTVQTIRRNRINPIGAGLAITAGAAVGIYAGSKATVILMGATAAPGAISTTTTVVNGTTMVLSKVAAGMAYKILAGVIIGGLTAFMIYKVYDHFTTKP